MDEAKFEPHFEKSVQGAVIGEHNTVTIINQERPEQSLSRQERLNRRRMLQRVSTIWIEGLLKQSLHHAAFIALGLQEKSSALENPWRLVVQEATRPTRPLSAGTRMIEVYDDAAGALLILGEPGAGKTTLLLELTRDLLERAQADETFPLPVVFNLSSWAKKRLPLTPWLVEELHNKYDVQRQIGEGWVHRDDLLLLLDGLDEVSPSERQAGIEAINNYREEHPLVPVVVCCRKTEYLDQPVQLHLHKAVVIQPLTDKQIDAYLQSAGAHMEALRDALSQDADLRELATTPLMLSILTLAYQETTLDDLTALDSLSTKRHQIFATYVERMLSRRSAEQQYPPQRTIHWLACLAQQMQRQNQTVFYIERMQPEWLVERRARQRYTSWVTGLVYGLFLLLPFGLLGGLGFGPALTSFLQIAPAFWSTLTDILLGVLIGLFAWVLFGVLNGLLSRLRTERRQIQGAARFWNHLRGSLIVGAGNGILIGFLALIAWLPTRQFNSVFTSFFGGSLVGGIAFGIIHELLGVQTAEIRPAEVFRWSWRSMLKKLLQFLGIGLLASLLVVFLIGFAFALFNWLLTWYLSGVEDNLQILQQSLQGWLSVLLLVLFSGGIIGLIGGLIGGASSNVLDERSMTRPNQGIYRSARHSALFALGGGLVGGLMIGVLGGVLYVVQIGALLPLGSLLSSTLLYGIIGVIVVGPMSALRVGGLACIEHLVLRVFLWHSGSLPRNYPHFLDYAAERILLRKVGSGYIFVHRLLLDYFATLEATPLPQTMQTEMKWFGLPAAPPPSQDALPGIELATMSTSKGVSRRTLLIGLASTGVAVVGGGLLRPHPLPQPLCIYRGHTSGVNALAWSPDSTSIASTGWDGTFQVWNATNGNRLSSYQEQPYNLGDVAWSADGLYFVYATYDGIVRIWNTRNDQHVFTYRLPNTGNSIQAVALSHDGTRIATFGSSEPIIEVWNATTGDRISSYRGQSSGSTIVWSPDDTRIASIGDGSVIEVWSAATGDRISTHRSQGNAYIVAWSRDGKRLASILNDKTIEIWNAATGDRITSYQQQSQVQSVAWSPDGARLASVEDGGQISKIVDLHRAITYGYAPSHINVVAWSPDGKRIATGCDSGLIIIWKASA